MNIARRTLILGLACPLAAAAAPDLKQSAAKIDALIEAGYDAHGVEPNPTADDATFVRRAHLDIVGRIPTAAEARVFIASDDPAKREKLIDSLLDSPGYLSHQFNFWADILRITSRMNGQSPENGSAYAKWVKDALRQNMPYDQFVRELVTAEGMIDENGAVGFYLRDRGMELDHLATTVQTFLGTQMVCAQCHDHPFDEWTQMDYYKLAAFSTPMRVVRNPESVDKAIQMVNQQARERQRSQRSKAKARETGKKLLKAKEDRLSQEESKNAMRGLNNLTANFRNSVVGETNRALKLPHDYQYDDAKPEQVVHAGTPFGGQPESEGGDSQIKGYADWMTSPENPRFTKTIANRLWKRVFGVGLFEPVDDIKETTEASNPELLAYLEELMVDLDFDLKDYYRVLYNTKTYGREAQSFDLLSGDIYYYPGPRLRRMSAEQIWDSIVTLMRSDVDTAEGQDASKYSSSSSSRLKAWRALEEQTPEALLERQAEVTKFTRDTEAKIEEFRKQVAKTIEAKDGEKAVELAREIMKWNVAATAEYARLTFWEVSAMKNGYFRTPFRRTPNLLYRELTKAFPGEDFPSEKGFYAGMEEGEPDEKSPEAKKSEQKKLRGKMGKEEYAKYQRKRAGQQRMRAYVRASEISSPAPEGHFLRVFGQSDRTLIENSNSSASVPQALSLMNGEAFKVLVGPYSVLSKELESAGDSDAMVDAVYLSMLSRRPTDEERALLRDEVATSGDDAAESLVWALLNTRQFLFVQ